MSLEVQVPIYTFGPEGSNGNASMKDVLGGKGANLCDMSAKGVPVPPGFVIPCQTSIDYLTGGGLIVPGLEKALATGLEWLTEQVKPKKKLGAKKKATPPLLMSVRSGSRVSMPGMMDTILNVGITPENLPALKEAIGDWAALDCYRRFLQMFGSVAMSLPLKDFEKEVSAAKLLEGVSSDADLSVSAMQNLVDKFSEIYSEAGIGVPDTVENQLKLAAIAVFESWNNDRAKTYRKEHKIPESWGTAVTVQRMVFGNLNDQSCTGVVFSRCPSTGLRELTGEYLVNAQGEDVVAGIRTPDPILKMKEWSPSLFEELSTTVYELEKWYGDMQDVEFTVEAGSLYVLQTRNGKRSAEAAFKIASDMMCDGTIKAEVAPTRVSAKQLVGLLKDRIDPAFDKPPLFKGIAAGGGVVTGVAVFDAETAVNCKQPCILVREETDPDDIKGMFASVGILTSTGGLTSHAAVVARGEGKACVVGATDMHVFSDKAVINGFIIQEFDEITIDGSTGSVWSGKVPMIKGGLKPEYREVCWGDNNKAVYVEVSDEEPQKAVADAVALSSNVALDMSVFFSGAESLKDLTAWAAEGIWLPVFDSLDRLVIDARRLMPREQVQFSMMFGVFDSVKVLSRLDSVLNFFKALPPDIRSKSVVLGDLSPGKKEYISSLGGKTSTTIATFQDLLQASGPVSVDATVVAEVFGSTQAYEAALSMVREKDAMEAALSKPGAKSGTVEDMPLTAHWYESVMKGGV